MNKDTIALMERERPSVAILRLALPMMLAMIAQMVYNMTDTFFIGQTGDPNMVAGISLAMPLFIISQGIGNIFGVGASSYISRLLGARKGNEAKQTCSTAFWTTVGMGIVITAALFIFRKPFLRISGASDVTFAYADTYFAIISAFMIPALLNIALSGQMRSEGATAKATQGMLIGIVLNVVLDPLFILKLNWGVAGAAWATITGMIASVTYYCFHFVSRRTVLSIHPKDFKPTARMYAEILKIGIPSALSNIAMTVCLVFRNRVAGSYGDFVVAGSGINQRIVSISFMLIMALAMGYQPFAGFNYGAKNFKRLAAGFRITILYSTVLSVFFTLVFALGGRFIFTLFIRDYATVDAGITLLHAFLWSLPFLGLQMTLMVTFQALGKSILATIVSLGRDFLFYLPLLFLFNRLWQFKGFMYCQPVADGLTTGVALALSSRLFRQLKNLDKEEAL
ncbi:MAG: MATE family efflux transporter [Spirochaetaceae bacterium]|jgi:putative MATE family efflux protein|nr:MATE family efflux transporter [Spirochaetaceae bacterium]